MINLMSRNVHICMECWNVQNILNPTDPTFVGDLTQLHLPRDLWSWKGLNLKHAMNPEFCQLCVAIPAFNPDVGSSVKLIEIAICSNNSFSRQNKWYPAQMSNPSLPSIKTLCTSQTTHCSTLEIDFLCSERTRKDLRICVESIFLSAYT